MAYLSHYTPHIPYTAKPHLVEKNQGAFEPVYAALIETLDDTIGLLMDKLDELHLADNTIFVFTSDNGGLHVPELRHERVTHNTPFRAGKGYVYEGGQRVPLIVSWPGHIAEGCVVDDPVNNIDWIPTLLDLAGAPSPSGLDGVSFADGLKGGAFPQRPLFWHFPHYTNQGGRPSGAMRDRNWMLIEPYDGGNPELYDLSTDCGEQHDVAGRHPDLVTSMQTALQEWRKANDVQYNTPNPDCDEAVFRRLYIDTDPGKFDPLTASPDAWSRIIEWRKQMNEVRKD